MRTHPLRFAAFAVALLALGAPLSAQGFGPGRGSGPVDGRGFRGLNLSEAQQVQVKAIHERHQAAFKAKGETAAAARKAVHEAMANTATDTRTLQALHEKASTAQFDLRLEHRAVRLEILPLLTAEQKLQFEKRSMGMGRGRGKGPGFGPRHGMGPDCPSVQPS